LTIFIIVIYKLLRPILWLLLFCLTINRPSSAQTAAKLSISPADLAKKMISNPAFVENAKGEDFCWNAAYDMGRFVEYYNLTKNPEWLDAGISYYDFLISRLDTDPDGYKGWIGPYEYDQRYWQDALVGDAILFKGLLDFCLIVLEEKTLNKKYGAKAKSYIALASKNFAEKWDKRGTWYEDGPYGSYIGFNKFLKPNDLSSWTTDSSVTRTGISHPFNKQLDAGQVFLRLYRITGKKEYKDRAQRIYFTLKSHFQYFDDHYCWNYFEPLTPDDVDLLKKDTKHGVWVHPFRSGYQAGEVEKIAEAYHYGIVFNEEDIKRIIRTNLDVMWNKDKLNPQFINSNGQGAEKDTTGAGGFKAAYGHGAEAKNTGELWTGLLDFDQTIRDLYALRFKKIGKTDERIAFENMVLNNPPGFERKYVKGPVKIPSVDFSESKALYLATVLPHRVAKGKSSIIVSKSWQPGILQIDLYSKSNRALANLFKGNVGEKTFIFTWDGKDPAKKTTYKGEYKIRWTIGSGYREFPIAID
jgi:hypothetical protein